jgi:hypothetical protein
MMMSFLRRAAADGRYRLQAAQRDDWLTGYRSKRVYWMPRGWIFVYVTVPSFAIVW